MRQPRPAGSAVTVVVLVLLALQVLAHGVLLAAMQELRAARAGFHLVEARVAAEGAVRRALGSPTVSGSDSLPVGSTFVLPEGRAGRVAFTVTVQRLSREVWLMGARAKPDGWPGSVARARLAWVIVPEVRVAAFRAVAHVGAAGSGLPEGSMVTEVLPESPASVAACAPWYAALDSLLVGRHLDPVVVDTTDALQLGLLDRALLLERASPQVGDSVTPSPTIRAGRCDGTDSSNWGDPGAERDPCADRFVFRARRGDLRIVGGVGQGLLVVTGDLSLEAGVDFRGLALVGGDLRLSGGSRLQGLVRAGGSLRLGDAARVLGSACWATRSIHAVRHRLDDVLPFPGWGWLTRS